MSKTVSFNSESSRYLGVLASHEGISTTIQVLATKDCSICPEVRSAGFC